MKLADGLMARLMSDDYAMALLESHWMQESAIRRYAARHGRKYVVLSLYQR